MNKCKTIYSVLNARQLLFCNSFARNRYRLENKSTFENYLKNPKESVNCDTISNKLCLKEHFFFFIQQRENLNCTIVRS